MCGQVGRWTVGVEANLKELLARASSNRLWAYTGEHFMCLWLQKFVPGVSPQPLVRVQARD
jgi:hypothetical protein